MIKIELKGNLNLKSIPGMIQAFRPGLEVAGTDKPPDIEIDLERLAFISAAPLAVLTAVVLRLVRAPERELSFVPPSDSGVDDYLARMDFYDLAEQPVRYRWTRRPSDGRFREPIEVGSIDRCHEVAQDLGQILGGQGGLDHRATRSVQNVLSELLENVYHHAGLEDAFPRREERVYAIACAQSYSQQNRVEIGIVDCGRGFEASLWRNPVYREEIRNQERDERYDFTAVEAIDLALGHRVTATPERNSGVGLFFTKRLVQQNQGRMYVLSGRGLRVVSASSWRRKTELWRGSILGLNLRTDRPLDIRAVFDRYYPPEDDYEYFEELTDDADDS